MITRGGVWITRAQPGAGSSASALQARGWRPLIAPLIGVSPLEIKLEIRSGEALAFTSAEGVRRAAALTPIRDVAVYAVGDATAAEARRLGFTAVRSAAGDVEVLTALILEAAPRSVLHPCALETAGDLVGALSANGVVARKAPVYQSKEADALDPLILRALEDGAIEALLLHSPKAGRAALRLLSGKEDQLAAIYLVGLSRACVDSLTELPWRGVVSARTPSEAALYEALEGTPPA